MLASSGEITEPCPVPISLAVTTPSSKTPAFSHLRMRRMMRLNHHLMRAGCLAQQLTAPLPDIAAKHLVAILRHPNQVILAVPDRMAATLGGLHAPVYTRHPDVPCRLKAWGFLIPYRGL